MPLSIEDHYFPEIEQRNILQARSIDAELVGVRPALVVRINPTIPAEMMLRRFCVETVGGKLVLALRDLEIVRCGR